MRRFLCAALLLGLGAAAHAGEALVFDAFASSDADHADVMKLGAGWLPAWRDVDHYAGIEAQHARFSGPGWHDDAWRLYGRFAGDAGGNWKWNAKIGSDGDTALGSASLYSEAGGEHREAFVERDMVETRLGAERGLYYTYAGVTRDFAITRRITLVGLAAVQDFTGSNLRTVLRGRAIWVASERYGVSLQLRTRYFHDSTPREFDYFSPRWFGEAVPTVNVQRFVRGWRLRAAAGYGRQWVADAGSDPARLAEVSAISPEGARGWHLQLTAGYSNTPISATYTYAYRYLDLAAVCSF